MSTAVILLNFGEPERPTPEEIVPFLERIFLANAVLDGDTGEAEARARSRALAERRAPGLLEDYRRIGGSPLARQARGQAEALEDELRARGHAVRAYVGMQFTRPLIPEAVARAREEGADRLVGLPAYPLCGPSTTLAALRELAAAAREAGWDAAPAEVSGWHRHPAYLRLRADAILRHADARGLDLSDPGTRLVFSAHGTPLAYVRAGSRYLEYVRDCCALVAAEAGVDDYVIGYQNHANRGVEWSRPDVEEVVRALDVERILVDAISFVHEQSETLAELDHDLREEAEEAGLEFQRVPVPHDDPRLAPVLADLVEPLVSGRPVPGLEPADCRCRPGAACLNAAALRTRAGGRGGP